MTTDASLLLSSFRERGFRFWLSSEGKPLVDPASRLTEEDWEALKGQRASLVALLQEEAAILAASESEPQPVPPLGVKIWLCRKDCAECEPGDEVYMWCWEGGPQWYYADRYPPPIQPPKVKKRPKKAEADEEAFAEDSP